MGALVPRIQSIVNGTLTITVLSPSAVAELYDRILIFSALTTAGPFSQITYLPLDGSASYSYCDLNSTTSTYYKVQYYNSTLATSSSFSDLAQETGVYVEYSTTASSPTYPPEIALSEDDRLIVETIRMAVGDLGLIERDFFDSLDPGTVFACSAQVSSDQNTWELSNFKGWPQEIRLNGILKTSLVDPLVRGYRYLTFSGNTSITGTLDIFYNHFRFSDREILLAYDRARNLLMSCGLTTAQITSEMLIMQAAILLLEGELREIQQEAIRIRDGDTEYDNTTVIRSRTGDLEDFKNKLRELIKCAQYYTGAYKVQGVRVD